MKKVWRQNRWLAWALGMFALGTVLLGLGMAEPALAQQAAPGFTNPVDGQAVSGDVVIQGTAVIDTFQKYELHFKQEPSGDDAFIYFDGGTQPVVNGSLGTWRASGLPAGTYSLRLRVVKADGNYAEYVTRNIALNLGPVPTPTSDQPTPTPIPVVTATFTPPPAQPTAAPVVVEQPAGVVDATPTPDPVAVQVDGSSSGGPTDSANANTAAASESSGAGSLLARELGEAVAVDRLQGEFFRGMRNAAGVVALLLAIFGGKALYAWYRTRDEFNG